MVFPAFPGAFLEIEDLSPAPHQKKSPFKAFRVGYVDASGVKVPAAQRIARPLQHGKNEFLLMMTLAQKSTGKNLLLSD
jgi:hypothetical protein